VNPPKKILIFRKSSLGDVILTLPVLRALKDRFPEVQIDYLTRSRYAPIIRDDPAVNDVITFHDNSSFLKSVRSLRSRKYDFFVDLQVNFQSLIVAFLLFPVRASRYKKRRLAREMIVRRPQWKLRVDHTVNAYLAALGHLGIDIPLSSPAMSLPAEFTEYAGNLIEKTLPSDCRKIIALCPGARYYEKKWPYDNFRAVAERLLDDSAIGILVISSSGDDVPADLELNHPRLVPVKNLEILRVAALLSKCRLAITNDSGIMHLSCASGTPVLAIFGPTSPRLGFSPTLPGSKVLCDEVFCCPCSVHGQKRCRQAEKYCFTEITPEKVINESLKMI
jgi:heptosyltransferase-2